MLGFWATAMQVSQAGDVKFQAWCSGLNGYVTTKGLPYGVCRAVVQSLYG